MFLLQPQLVRAAVTCAWTRRPRTCTWVDYRGDYERHGWTCVGTIPRSCVIEPERNWTTAMIHRFEDAAFIQDFLLHNINSHGYFARLCDGFQNATLAEHAEGLVRSVVGNDAPAGRSDLRQRRRDDAVGARCRDVQAGDSCSAPTWSCHAALQCYPGHSSP